MMRAMSIPPAKPTAHQPTLDPNDPLPPLKAGVDGGVYSYLRRKRREIPAIREKDDEAPEVRQWRSDLLYNVGAYFGTTSETFQTVNVFRALNPWAFTDRERLGRELQDRHRANMDRLETVLAGLMEGMERR